MNYHNFLETYIKQGFVFGISSSVDLKLQIALIEQFLENTLTRIGPPLPDTRGSWLANSWYFYVRYRK